MKQREIKTNSKNLKSGFFKESELELYELTKEEIKIIMEYQEKLPILQENNDNWIDMRDLWEQLGVARDYTNWIKQQIEDLALEKDIDYRFSLSKAKSLNFNDGRPNSIYLMKVSTAKEVAMIAGAKGGRTSKTLKENSQLARKYFITIESAFKTRLEWNFDRDDSIDMFKGLKHALIKYQKQLRPTLPEWSHNNTYIAESCMLNNVLLGMSASEYRKTLGLNKKDNIRNTFTEEQLEDLAELEKYDADLIIVQNIFDYNKRQNILEKKYLTMVR